MWRECRLVLPVEKRSCSRNSVKNSVGVDEKQDVRRGNEYSRE